MRTLLCILSVISQLSFIIPTHGTVIRSNDHIDMIVGTVVDIIEMPLFIRNPDSRNLPNSAFSSYLSHKSTRHRGTLQSSTKARYIQGGGGSRETRTRGTSRRLGAKNDSRGVQTRFIPSIGLTVQVYTPVQNGGSEVMGGGHRRRLHADHTEFDVITGAYGQASKVWGGFKGDVVREITGLEVEEDGSEPLVNKVVNGLVTAFFWQAEVMITTGIAILCIFDFVGWCDEEDDNTKPLLDGAEKVLAAVIDVQAVGKSFVNVLEKQKGHTRTQADQVKASVQFARHMQTTVDSMVNQVNAVTEAAYQALVGVSNFWGRVQSYASDSVNSFGGDVLVIQHQITQVRRGRERAVAISAQQHLLKLEMTGIALRVKKLRTLQLLNALDYTCNPAIQITQPAVTIQLVILHGHYGVVVNVDPDDADTVTYGLRGLLCNTRYSLNVADSAYEDNMPLEEYVILSETGRCWWYSIHNVTGGNFEQKVSHRFDSKIAADMGAAGALKELMTTFKASTSEHSRTGGVWISHLFDDGMVEGVGLDPAEDFIGGLPPGPVITFDGVVEPTLQNGVNMPKFTRTGENVNFQFYAHYDVLLEYKQWVRDTNKLNLQRQPLNVFTERMLYSDIRLVPSCYGPFDDFLVIKTNHRYFYEYASETLRAQNLSILHASDSLHSLSINRPVAGYRPRVTPTPLLQNVTVMCPESDTVRFPTTSEPIEDPVNPLNDTAAIGQSEPGVPREATTWVPCTDLAIGSVVIIRKPLVISTLSTPFLPINTANVKPTLEVDLNTIHWSRVKAIQMDILLSELVPDNPFENDDSVPDFAAKIHTVYDAYELDISAGIRGMEKSQAEFIRLGNTKTPFKKEMEAAAEEIKEKIRSASDSISVANASVLHHLGKIDAALALKSIRCEFLDMSCILNDIGHRITVRTVVRFSWYVVLIMVSLIILVLVSTVIVGRVLLVILPPIIPFRSHCLNMGVSFMLHTTVIGVVFLNYFALEVISITREVYFTTLLITPTLLTGYICLTVKCMLPDSLFGVHNIEYSKDDRQKWSYAWVIFVAATEITFTAWPYFRSESRILDHTNSLTENDTLSVVSIEDQLWQLYFPIWVTVSVLWVIFRVWFYPYVLGTKSNSPVVQCKSCNYPTLGLVVYTILLVISVWPWGVMIYNQRIQVDFTVILGIISPLFIFHFIHMIFLSITIGLAVAPKSTSRSILLVGICLYNTLLIITPLLYATNTMVRKTLTVMYNS